MLDKKEAVKTRFFAEKGNLPLVLFMTLYPMLFVWQGLDITDTGYLATLYERIFKDPESIRLSGFAYWLTDVIGGAVLKGLGDSLLSIHIAAALVIYGTMIMTYLTLVRVFPRQRVLIALAVTLLCLERRFWLSYDNLTAFFFVAAAYCLIRGIMEKRLTVIGLSGILIGLNIFIRLPNISGIGFLAVIVMAHFITPVRSWRSTAAAAAVFLAGVGAAVAAMIGIMAAMGHLHLFANALRYLFTISGDAEATHSFSHLLSNLGVQHIDMIKGMLALAAFLLVYCVGLAVLRKLLRGRWELIYYAALVVPLLAAGWYFFHWERRFIYVLLGIQYLVLAVHIFHPKQSSEIRLLSLLALMIIHAASIGSDNGLVPNAKYGMYLSTSLVIGLLLQSSPKLLSLPRKWLAGLTWGKTRPVLQVAILLVVCLCSVRDVWMNTFRDSSDRLLMNTTIDHPKLAGVFTHKARAESVSELLDGLSGYVQPGDKLLAYENIPLVYYLTDASPYLGTSWPLLLKPSVLQTAIEESLASQKSWPVVARAKFSTFDKGWPESRQPLVTDRPVYPKDREMLDAFVKQNGYSVVWENDFFQILTSDKGL